MAVSGTLPETARYGLERVRAADARREARRQEEADRSRAAADAAERDRSTRQSRMIADVVGLVSQTFGPAIDPMQGVLLEPREMERSRAVIAARFDPEVEAALGAYLRELDVILAGASVTAVTKARGELVKARHALADLFDRRFNQTF